MGGFPWHCSVILDTKEVLRGKRGCSLRFLHTLLYGKRQNKKNKYKNVEIPWPKTTWGRIVGGPLWDGEKNKKRGIYRVNPAFSATYHYHAACTVCIVCI